MPAPPHSAAMLRQSRSTRPRWPRRASETDSSRKADECRGRTVVLHARCTETPDDVVVPLRPVHRRLALGATAHALTAGTCSAAVAIGDQVRARIFWVDARADPRCRSGLGTRWTGVNPSAAACA